MLYEVHHLLESKVSKYSPIIRRLQHYSKIAELKKAENMSALRNPSV